LGNGNRVPWALLDGEAASPDRQPAVAQRRDMRYSAASNKGRRDERQRAGAEKQSTESKGGSAMPSGGKRIGAGRKPGVVGAAKRALADMAQDHADLALQTLVDIARTGEGEAARVSAATAILDRAYGKPSQMMIGAGSIGLTVVIAKDDVGL